jgi:hypothetical protein
LGLGGINRIVNPKGEISMTAYQEAKLLLQQSLDLLGQPRKEGEPVPTNSALFFLSKALLLLTQAVEADFSEIRKTTEKLQPRPK